MHPRGRLDIGWSDLIFALRESFRSDANPEEILRRIERFWGSDQTLVALSVRTGFDALLQALDLPKGSEILVSAITIRDMVRIIEAHDLIPVPIDLDMDRLTARPELIRAAITPKTRAILIAHIFGSRMDLEEISRIARENDLLLIEDFAQAYARREDRGDTRADISMFSFGPIKTNTALAGGILTIRDRDLLARTREITQAYPRQESQVFRTRIRKYMGIKAISYPVPFGLLAFGCKLAGKTHDQVISHALRGFPGPDLLTKLRKQPSAPLLALIERRITRFDNRRIDQRRAIASTIWTLMPGVEHPGDSAIFHAHWVVPICIDNPDELMKVLWKAGFDATRGASSLTVIDPPANRSECEPTNARRSMNRLLYLPVSQDMKFDDLQKLAEIVNQWNVRSLKSLPENPTAGSALAAD